MGVTHNVKHSVLNKIIRREDIMYYLERTKKIIIALFCLSGISLVLSFIGFAGGGEELIR